MPPDIECTRTWRFEGADGLLFEESLEGSTAIGFETRVCLGDAEWGPLEWDSTTGRGMLKHRQGQMSIETVPETKAEIEECTFLEEYGLTRKGRVLTVTGERARLPMKWRLRFSFEGK